MGLTRDLGRRIDLISMDSWFHDISIGLYQEKRNETTDYLVHSYSQIRGTEKHLESVTQRMATLGGLEVKGGRLRFSCGEAHELACRRVFVETCKVDPAAKVKARPLVVFDKKSDRNVTVSASGHGVYRIVGEGAEARVVQRRLAVGAGLVKLGQMEWVELNGDRFAFTCRKCHESLVGLLLVRALNVRGAEREQEMLEARGRLLAPSTQKE